jgi:hypothetical protein
MSWFQLTFGQEINALKLTVKPSAKPRQPDSACQIMGAPKCNRTFVDCIDALTLTTHFSPRLP